LQLVSTKCLPILLYGFEVCDLKKNDFNSLDFVVNRLLMKLFKTNNMATISECAAYFNFKLPSALLVSRFNKFVSKYKYATITFVNYCLNLMYRSNLAYCLSPLFYFLFNFIATKCSW
jgi:hypothetical protein